MIDEEPRRAEGPTMPWGRTFLLGLGFFGIQLLWPLYDSFVPIFLSRFGLSAFAVGVLMTVDNYANMFIQPWIGQRSDRTRSRFGRRYPYIMVGAPLTALGFALLPVAVGQGLVPLLLAMGLTTCAAALFRSPTVALLGDVFHPTLRSRANGVINFMGLLASILAFLVGGALYARDPRLPFWLAPLGMLLVLGLLFVLIREPEAPQQDEAPPEGLRALLGGLVQPRQRPLLLTLLALVAWSLGITAIQTFFTLFGQTELGLEPSTAAQFLSFFPIAGLLCAIPAGFLGTALGRRHTLIACLTVLMVLLAALFFVRFEPVPPDLTLALTAPATWFAHPSLRLLVGMLLAAGAMLTVITVNILPLLMDFVPASQSGSVTGLYYLFGSVASVVGPPLAGALADLTGSYRIVFGFAALCVALAIGLLSLTQRGDTSPGTNAWGASGP